MGLALLLAVVAGGTLATYLWDEDETPLLVRLAAGAVVGLAVFGLVGFVLASGLGLRLSVVVVAALAPLALIASAGRRARLLADIVKEIGQLRSRPGRALAVVAAAALIAVIFAGALYVRNGAIYTADQHNLGDLPFHVGIAMGFLQGDNFPPEHPELSGVRLTYPFLADFVVAALMRGGASLQTAFLAENLLLAWALVVLLVHWGRRLTRDRAAAALIPALVLLSGGLGFWMLARDALESERGVIPLLASLPHDYTIVNDGSVSWLHTSLRWGNAITTLFIPQRGFLFGLPLFVLALTLVWEGVRRDAVSSAATRGRCMVAAGCIAGLLPLVHMHSFFVFVAAALCLAVLFRSWRHWGWCFVALLLVSVPQLLWFFGGAELVARRFVQWHVGWDHGATNPLLFWLHNTGLVFPAAMAALLWRDRDWLVSRDMALLLAPFAGCFVIPNLLQLSPWIWDNIKFLFFAHLAAAPLVALLIVWLWRYRMWGARVAAIILFVSLTLAGALDVTRVVMRQGQQRIFDLPGAQFAEWLNERTEPRAVMLRAPTYNHAVLLAGRRSPLGYPGHIWSQGMDQGTREEEVAMIYRGVPDAADRLRRLGADFVIFGPDERGSLQVDQAFLATLPLVGEVDGYRLYRVRDR